VAVLAKNEPFRILGYASGYTLRPEPPEPLWPDGSPYEIPIPSKRNSARFLSAVTDPLIPTERGRRRAIFLEPDSYSLAVHHHFHPDAWVIYKGRVIIPVISAE
jgi:hypothetical protein